MRILLTGATGFIGRSLTLTLHRHGHEVMAWTRSPNRATQILGPTVSTISATDEAGLVAALSSCDAIIHLAGEPLFGRRWTATQQRRLLDSRVHGTANIVKALRSASPRPRVMISASGIDYYAPGEQRVSEEDTRGSAFLSDVCDQWETTAREADSLGVRTVQLRMGIVLGLEGGVLGRLLPLFLARLGGRLGSGQQWMSWIHLEDLLEVIRIALTDEHYTGPINCTAPDASRNAEFTQALARATHRPALFPAPSLALRIVVGKAAEVITASHRANPKKLRERGFQHRFPTLGSAFEDLIGHLDSVRFQRATTLPSSAYLKQRGARYQFQTSTMLHAGIKEVFPFFSRAENLGAITPDALAFHLKGGTPSEMAAGEKVHYTIRVGPLTIPWETTFDTWEPPERFVDVQTGGPYRSWWHEHRFTAQGERTRMDDCIYYQPRWGWLGRMANVFYVENMLRRIFAFRSQAMALRFGAERPSIPDEG